VAGAPMGVGSLKPKKKKGNFIWHEFFFLFNQSMNILGGRESYNTLVLKKMQMITILNKIRPYTTLNLYPIKCIHKT
jgi:hypothetical protein